MDIKHLNLGMVNAYLVKNDDRWFLVDTGISIGRQKLERALAEHGVRPKDLSLVVVTHADMDHIGNCAYLQREYGVSIAVHEADAELCRTGKRHRRRKRKTSLLEKALTAITFALVFKPLLKKQPVEAFEPDMILADGMDFNSWGWDARVVSIPGHTKGSIGILTTQGDFFSGDTINNRTKPAPAHIVDDEKALVKSLNKILTLNIHTIYPGHGQPFPVSGLKFLFR